MQEAEEAPGSVGMSEKYASRVGLDLHRLEFAPRTDAVGGIMLVHGLGDHIGRYHEIGSFFAERGLHAVGVDFPGHGVSPGVRGHVEDWEAFEGIFLESIALLRERVGPDLPLGVMAHSMGAFVTLRFLEQDPDHFKFAWLSSPLVRPGRRRGPLMRLLARLMARVVPSMTLDTGVRPEMCRPVAGEEDIDPLSHHRVSSSLGVMFLEMEKEVMADVGKLNPDLALLITQGEDDEVTPPIYAQELFGRILVGDKEFVPLPGVLHEPFRHDNGEQVLAAAGWWMDRLGYPVVG